ncbi:YceI family protein [Flammeovirga pacifica]|uniref:Lipid/polyisoprenoid-binding YceI-like domain-containing protein n=1 Tax=Flammeovirga pacifica TaxID=915059 RepID=A0A1S1YV64_FLAPC|nr:YceI family protein [Flammeovirga pacifica]OHX64900.1 hypothetical protein NH26_00345 [Flammeovirga pacifica]
MKATKLTIVLFLFFLTSTFSQTKYYTEAGNCKFSASVPAFEPIEAESKGLIGILDEKTGNIAAVIPINSFEFAIALMQEHFNENYLESNKYPKATFKGNIQNFIPKQSGQYDYEGTLQIHGEERTVKGSIEINFQDNHYDITTKLIVKPEDYKIKIPKIVYQKIAETVHIHLQLRLFEKS